MVFWVVIYAERKIKNLKMREKALPDNKRGVVVIYDVI